VRSGKFGMDEKIKILIVDDEQDFRSITKKILDRKGFDTILAGSGEEAIDKLKENPDVVILDIKMPGMDGHQTLREIKNHSPDLPVIMLSGHGALPSARESYVEGAFDYLLKPCDIDLLVSKIIEACQHGKEEPSGEKRVMDVMIPVADYNTLTEEDTVGDAIAKLKESFSPAISTSRIMELGPRSLLVFDYTGRVNGLLTSMDLLKGIIPGYLKDSKVSMADSVRYSPMFWTGMFKREVQDLARKKIKEIMSPAPLTIEGETNLMEAAFMMVKNNVRRLVVVRLGKVIGVIRDQDLFFAMESRD